MKLLLLVALLLPLPPVLAHPPPPGSEDATIMHDFVEWITSRQSRTGEFCCDISDGRPLMAGEIRVVDDHYEVLYTKRHWDSGTEGWLRVPKEAILQQLSPVGYPIAWIDDGRVVCLSLTGTA